jgi:hypothetical protein
VLHHLYGNPIVPFVSDSSFGCAICDPVMALWCFVGAPSVYDLFRGKGENIKLVATRQLSRTSDRERRAYGRVVGAPTAVIAPTETIARKTR